MDIHSVRLNQLSPDSLLDSVFYLLNFFSSSYSFIQGILGLALVFSRFVSIVKHPCEWDLLNDGFSVPENESPMNLLIIRRISLSFFTSPEYIIYTFIVLHTLSIIIFNLSIFCFKFSDFPHI